MKKPREQESTPTSQRNTEVTPILENQMENNMENEMATGGI